MTKPILVLFAATFGALLGVACGDDSKRPPVASDGPVQPGGGGGFVSGTPSDGGRSDGGGDAGAGDAGACNDLPNTGAPVDQTAVNDDLPAGSGGVVQDGVYDITNASVFQGVTGQPGLTGNTFQGSIRITGSKFERVVIFRSAAGAASETRVIGTFTPAGINGTIALSCPVATQEQVTFSVVNNALTISNLVTKESFIFTKQL